MRGMEGWRVDKTVVHGGSDVRAMEGWRVDKTVVHGGE